MFAAVFCYASVPLFLKYFTGFLDAWTVNGIRYSVAALFWLPFILHNHGRAPEGRNVWRDAVPPAVANTIGQVSWALAPYHNDAVFIGFVIRSSFLFAMIFGFAFLPDERTIARRPSFWVGAVGILAGLIAMYCGGLRHGGTSPLGMMILVATSVCWGLYAVSVRRYMAGYSARLSFGVISLYTSASLLVLMFLFGNWRRSFELVPVHWLLLVVSAFIGIAFSHVLLYRSIHALGAVVTQGGVSIQPFLTALGASLILGERLAFIQWLGGLILAASCFCLLFAKGLGRPRMRQRPRK